MLWVVLITLYSVDQDKASSSLTIVLASFHDVRENTTASVLDVHKSKTIFRWKYTVVMLTADTLNDCVEEYIIAYVELMPATQRN